MKFTRSQILLLLNIQDAEKTQYFDERGYYAECGRFKPYVSATIMSLKKKGFIVVNAIACDGSIFFCKPGPKFNEAPKFTWDDYVRAK